ncbi:hypothetical protein HMPREF0083_05427 [Aneurinibacillus aneurinilyticus ATCC 12856]|uniref:Uncharacterized protein n=1 Tax=Aneurinibacillus aneurinilyticus ATCC 12856 TaxID=649747 RepID=U1Y1C4_ANEAE|nr:hypothetical protein HMPREF0083_05427 [Aneurinibacillus aneurinilyticus ATCC 12856]
MACCRARFLYLQLKEDLYSVLIVNKVNMSKNEWKGAAALFFLRMNRLY